MLEVLRGDATNFVSVEELDASWAVFSPALLALEGTRPERYANGSMGPSLERLCGSPKVDSWAGSVWAFGPSSLRACVR